MPRTNARPRRHWWNAKASRRKLGGRQNQKHAAIGTATKPPPPPPPPARQPASQPRTLFMNAGRNAAAPLPRAYLHPGAERVWVDLVETVKVAQHDRTAALLSLCPAPVLGRATIRPRAGPPTAGGILSATTYPAAAAATSRARPTASTVEAVLLASRCRRRSRWRQRWEAEVGAFGGGRVYHPPLALSVVVDEVAVGHLEHLFRAESKRGGRERQQHRAAQVGLGFGRLRMKDGGVMSAAGATDIRRGGGVPGWPLPGRVFFFSA